jgi:copper transport protein
VGRPARRQVVAPERRVGQLRDSQARDPGGGRALKRALAACALVAAAWPGAAWAHASLVETKPADGAVLVGSPAQVRVLFDDDVRPATGADVVANDGRHSVLDGSPKVVGGRTLVLPLRPRLADGDYTVRWSIVSDDGHREQGVLAFAVGAGRAPPTPVLTAETELRWEDVLLRTLFLLGALVAAGALLQLRGGPASRGLVFVAFAVAAGGGSSLLHAAEAGGTRYALALEVGTVAALVGGTAAALWPWYPFVRPLVWAAAAVLLVVPTLSGHALDPGRPHLLTTVADLAHVGAASAWLGGLAALAVATGPDERAPAARRLSRVALVSVAVLAVTGGVRALIELDRVSQLWSTGYGRAILVKTALFAALVGIGWANRSRLLPSLARAGAAFTRLRRNVLAETGLLTGVVIAVAVLTSLRPAGQAVVASRAAPAGTPPLPPLGALHLARQDRDLAVAIAVRRDGLTATLLGPDGNAFPAGAGVRIDGKPAASASCGPGCLNAPLAHPPRVVAVTPDGYPPVEFRVPAAAPPATALLVRAEQAFRALETVTVEESIASGPRPPQRSRQLMVAPDRFEFRLADGTAGIVVGGRRWDRVGRGAWQPGVQAPPLRLPTPLWSRARRDARLIGPHRIAFLDPRLPAWFDVSLDPRTGLPLKLHMIAAAHFMSDRYSRFDRPTRIVPPH